ncbi:hydrogenase maturation protease [Candidatus Gracilibacteria bacterium]|nr:hydrogenase maturation protease [Candidatus Gracilibacteria bacterium]
MYSIELTANGYLHLPAELARERFPHDVLVALSRGDELWLLPTRGAAAGGLLLKQRNLRGDRSVLIWEVLPPATAPGLRPATWDAENGALRVVLANSESGYQVRLKGYCLSWFVGGVAANKPRQTKLFPE